VLPIAIYSLRAEKSTAVTCPSGVLDVGQFPKAVRDGRCTCERKGGQQKHMTQVLESSEQLTSRIESFLSLLAMARS